jgi:hypothetical protein
MRQSIYIAMFLLGSLSLARCQEGPVPAFAQGNGPSDEAVVLPAIVSGDSASPLFPAEGERSNYLSGGLSFITAYDDNALATSSDRVSDTSFALMPYISFNQTRSRLRWQMDYAPGFTFYQRFDGRNQDDQNLSVALEYRLTPHVTVRLKDAFVKTSNFLGGPGQVQQSPFGLAQQSNLTVITPIADRISNGGSGEVNWQFGPNSVLGARGLSYVLHFPDTQNAADLSDTHSQAGEAFVAHRISRIHWVSATYRYQRIVTDLDNSTTLTHSLLLSYTLNFTPTMSFSLFAGPQHADTTSQSIAPSQKWLPAAGATYSWQTNHLGFETNLAHKISDGGGLAAAVRLTTLDAYVRYEWAKNWLARFGGSYGKNELIEPLATFSQDSRSAIGLVAISHQIGEHLTIEASYVRANQKYLDASNGWVAFNRNRPQISISYGFSRPIGR